MSHDLSKIYRRLLASYTIGKLTTDSNETGNYAKGQMKTNDLLTHDYGILQQYGFASALLAGCDVGRCAVGGNSGIGTIIASNDNRYRPVGMKAGEVQVHDNTKQSIYLQNGMKIVVTANDEVDISIGNKVIFSVTASTVTINADVQINGKTTGTGDGVFNNISVDSHVHGGVQGGDDDTSGPQ